MADMQTGRRGEQSVFSKTMDKLRSNYAGGVLGLNLSVAVKQAASYPTAAAILDADCLAKALVPGQANAVDLDMVNAYSSNLWYRSQGYTTQELGDLQNRNQSTGEKLTSHKRLNIIQGMDVWTTTRLWKAAEYHVEKHFPELAALKDADMKELRRGDNAFYQKVAEVYNQVIEQTQPNYAVMQRPGLLRDSSDLVRAITMFKTQPFQNFNILYDAFGERGARAREYNANPTDATRYALTQANQKAVRAVLSQAVSSFVFAFMQYAWDAFRRKDDRYKDEDGNLTLLTWARAMGINMAQNGFGMVPFGSEVFSIIGSWTDAILKGNDLDPFFETYFYGFEVSFIAAANDVLAKDVTPLIQSTMKVMQAMDADPEDGGKNPDWRKLGWNVWQTLSDVLMLRGIPAENVRKTLAGLSQWFLVGSAKFRGDSPVMGEYDILDFTTDKELNAKPYYDLLFRAGGRKLYPDPEGKNVPKQYQAVYNHMIEDGFSPETIQGKMLENFRLCSLTLYSAKDSL